MPVARPTRNGALRDFDRAAAEAPVLLAIDDDPELLSIDEIDAETVAAMPDDWRALHEEMSRCKAAHRVMARLLESGKFTLVPSWGGARPGAGRPRKAG